MKSFFLKSPAKINLTLDILGKDEQAGKHFINTIFYRDDNLFDEITLRKRLSGHKNLLKCSNPDVPTDESNTVLKALKLLGEEGWEISLKKNIPMRAGLGGGSSNAGVILKYFGRIKGIPEHILMEMAQKIGADVPFFVLDDNLAYFEGYGDQFVKSWQIKPLKIEYINSGVSVSTAKAYAELDLSECALESAKTEALLEIFNNTVEIKAAQLEAYLHNDFESSFFKKNHQLEELGNLCGSGGMMWSLK